MAANDSGYRGVNLKRALLDEVDDFVEADQTYSSTAAFVSEAVRSHLRTLKDKIGSKKAGVA